MRAGGGVLDGICDLVVFPNNYIIQFSVEPRSCRSLYPFILSLVIVLGQFRACMRSFVSNSEEHRSRIGIPNREKWKCSKFLPEVNVCKLSLIVCTSSPGSFALIYFPEDCLHRESDIKQVFSFFLKRYSINLLIS
jgi:hypothetical protein